MPLVQYIRHFPFGMSTGGEKSMNVSDLWDFTFFWQMFRNFIATAAPFVMVVMAVYVVKLLLSSIMSAVARRKE